MGTVLVQCGECGGADLSGSGAGSESHSSSGGRCICIG